MALSICFALFTRKYRMQGNFSQMDTSKLLC